MSVDDQPLDYEAEYNNARRVADSGAIVKRWQVWSPELRATANAEFDLAYGPAARNRYDLYQPPDASQKLDSPKPPLAVYIHGGYWQARDKSDFSFTARGLLAHGVAYAMPNYTLCPETTIQGIIEETRRFLVALWQKTGQRPVVIGHSAGGHLAAAMVATDWSTIDGAPDDLVIAGYAISGVFELTPLIGTSLNAALRLDQTSADAVSPLLWPAPSSDRWLTAAVGGDESQEFLRQSLDIIRVWNARDIKAECVVVPGTNHFTVIEDLARADSAMVHRISALARAVAV